MITLTQLEFAGGEGTAEAPYQITKLEHLNKVRNHLDKKFVLMNNLNFGEDSDYVIVANKNIWTTGEGWVPIGTSEARFTGVFDGNGKTITGIVINRVAAYQGLFRYTGEGAEIKNGSLKEINITGSDYVGGLAGYNLGTITSFSSDGSVSGVKYVGGLVGNDDGVINNSYSKADVSGSDRFCGGLAGHSFGIINNSYATGNVTADVKLAGGLLGGVLTATINNSYATGRVNGGTQVAGGLIGSAMMSSINNSYATGSVTASTESAGGLIGSTFAGTINNSYAVGSITEGPVSRGGLIGTSLGDPTINNSYYDSQNSGLSDTGKGIPKTTMEMKTSATFTGWDFGTVWNIINNETHLSYPYLRTNEQYPFPGYATKPSTSDGDSGDNSGDERRNDTPVNSDISVVAAAAIEKQTTTTPTGQTIEKFTIQAGASAQIEQAKAEGKTSVQFNIDSSQTSVTGINIPTAVIASAANMNISINTPNATLELPAALVNALAAAGQDLSITVTRGGEVTNPVDATVLGTPTTISTDILGTTQVTIPLEGINLPVDPQEREAFLASLAVFTLHSDGEEELINGTIIYDESGNAISISFPVDKFSTFAIIKMSKKSISLTIDSNMAAINGIRSTLDSGPYIDALTNRTLAPLRFVGESLGAKVEWLGLSREIRITDGKKEIMLAIDSNVVYIDGQKMQIDCAPVIALSGRTFLPLRFVSESLGAKVNYNAAARQISIIREY